MESNFNISKSDISFVLQSLASIIQVHRQFAARIISTTYYLHALWAKTMAMSVCMLYTIRYSGGLLAPCMLHCHVGMLWYEQLTMLWLPSY